MNDLIQKKRKMCLWDSWVDIDELCVDTMSYLNETLKLKTFGSCCGDKETPYIAFYVFNKDSLFPLLAFLKKMFRFKKNFEIKPIDNELGKGLSIYFNPGAFDRKPIDWSKRRFKEEGFAYFWSYLYENIKGFDPKNVPKKDVQDIILKCNKCGFIGKTDMEVVKDGF